MLCVDLLPQSYFQRKQDGSQNVGFDNIYVTTLVTTLVNKTTKASITVRFDYNIFG